MIIYNEFGSDRINEVKEIYNKESWKAYLTDDEKLIRTFNNSLFLLGAFEGSKLVGFIRCVGDGEHVLLVQDLIVDPDYQRQGIGTYLFKKILEKYSSVRMFMVMTDEDDIVDNKFYQSFGLKKLEQMNMVGYIRV